MHLLSENVPWYAIGILMALVVSGMFAWTNRPIGASGSYAQLTDKMLGKPVKEPWRLTFMCGVVIGGAVGAWFTKGLAAPWSYGQLGNLLPVELLTPILFVGGIFMGYGARWMGGCTSGHGLCGTASRSPASFAATATFFVTAVIVTYLLHVMTGGRL